MKIFISWSGPVSRSVAEALRDWLPPVLQSVKPYVSSQDIDKGARWDVEIGRELETSDYGIICVTPGNVGKPWLNFEAGALAKSFEKGVISPFLFGVDQPPTDGPLSLFQATFYNRDDVLALVRSINARTETSLDERVLERVFRTNWPSLKEALDPLLDSAAAERDSEKHITEAMFNELLEAVRPQKPAPVPVIGPRSKLATPGAVDMNEALIHLARLGAATDSIPPHTAETPFMVELRARIMLLIKTLSPMVDSERLESLTQMYVAEAAAATARDKPLSHPA